MKWVLVGVVLVIGVLSAVTPRMSRPTVPLGVSVPSARIGDPVVRTSVRRFMLGCALATLVSFLLVMVLPELLAVTATLAEIGLILVVYVVTRRSIIEAKQRDGWYTDVPVRISGSLSVERKPVAWWPYAVSLLTLAGVAAYGATRYADMPGRVVTHTGADGMPDAWGSKNVWTVFGPVAVGVGLVLVMALCGWAVRRSERPTPDGNRRVAARRGEVTARASERLLAFLTFSLTVGLSALVLMQWHDIVGGPVLAVLALILAVPLVAIAVYAWRILRVDGEQRAALNGSDPSSANQLEPETPDDDRHWVGGIVYNNPDDPRVLVPKRFGVGLTVNYARPGGKAFYWGVLAVTLIAVTLPLVVQ